MSSKNFIAKQLKRLGAVPNRFDVNSPIPSLVSSVSDLKLSFRGSTKRYRDMLTHYHITDLVEFSDDELEEEMPLIRGFVFADAGGFYNGWKRDIPNVTKKFTPFAHDIYCYYFLAKNRKCICDPLVYCIDHETLDQKPESHFGLTAGMILATLEKEKSSKPAKKSHPKAKSKERMKLDLAVKGFVENNSSDDQISWEVYETGRYMSVSLTIRHHEFPTIANAMSMAWQCLFITLSGRKIQEVILRDSQTGFDFKVKSKPQISEISVHVEIDRMFQDFEDESLMDKYWRAAEIGLHKSKVLRTYEASLSPDFKLTGAAIANKTYQRNLRPRTT